MNIVCDYKYNNTQQFLQCSCLFGFDCLLELLSSSVFLNKYSYSSLDDILMKK